MDIAETILARLLYMKKWIHFEIVDVNFTWLLEALLDDLSIDAWFSFYLLPNYYLILFS